MTTYRGRFAPSPSGPLHFGSLIAAVASYLDARAHQGSWLLRIDDIDTARCKAGATEQIQTTLQAFGMHWDEAILYQSQRLARYQSLLEQLLSQDLLYPCSCTRKDLQHLPDTGMDGPVYPGTCRAGMRENSTQFAYRLRTQPLRICFQDAVQGERCQSLETEVGDFIVRRADGIFAYQLAVVADDADQGITTVVRGADLLFSTPRQLYLQQLLGFAKPDYLHVPVALDAAGKKLSKSDQARSVDTQAPIATLNACLNFLGQEQIHTDQLERFWSQAIANWQRARIPLQNQQVSC